MNILLLRAFWVPWVFSALCWDFGLVIFAFAELLRERIALANDVRDYVGKYFSVNYVRKNILKQNEREIADIDKQIKQEIDDGIIASPQTSVSGNNPDEII